MSKKEELLQTYMKDVDSTSSKQKFGFFSMPASAFAGSTTFEQKTVHKDDNGKVKTQQRNIFSGISASGVLKKNYFSYPEHKAGELYMDPGKVDRQREMKDNEKFKDKDTFRPASLNKTLSHAPYQYVPQKETKKDPKSYRKEDGRVRIQNPNVMSSPPSKLAYKSQSQLKYIGEPYENARLQNRKQLFQDISKRGENAFKPSSPIKELFSSHKEQFHMVDVPEKKHKEIAYNIQQHDSKFKPAGSHFNDGMFSYPKHMPQETGTKDEVKMEKVLGTHNQKKEPFKLIKQEKNSRPCPSISLSKMNLMRCIR